jgi:hypothetical protein
MNGALIQAGEIMLSNLQIINTSFRTKVTLSHMKEQQTKGLLHDHREKENLTEYLM